MRTELLLCFLFAIVHGGKNPIVASKPVVSAVPRLIKISGQQFIDVRTNKPIVLGGPNVVVKGPPYLPLVSGNTICNDIVDSYCSGHGNCSTCSTFNQADVDHIKSRGWNFIRLGVVWAGAQTKDGDQLDPDFLERLHALLNLTDANGLHVMLDNHGDMTGTLGCGNGVPAWFQLQAPGVKDLVGKPLEAAFPYGVLSSLNVKKLPGYEVCGENESMWSKYAGDPNYNMLNECCVAINSGNPGATGYTTISQKTMDYMINPGKGRDSFVKFWRLMAEAVAGHQSASFFELDNEPMSIHRERYFDTWKAAADAIHDVIPEASVSICDIGEASLLPSWMPKFAADFIISKPTLDWIQSGNVPSNIKNMKAISEKWNIPTFATETDCTQFEAAREANISHSYWHYSAYCNFPNRGYFSTKGIENAFGACILGWGSGSSSKCL